MSDPQTEQLGLGDFAKVLEFLREAQQFYTENKAEIDALIEFGRKVIAFFRGLKDGTGGGFQS